MRKFLFSVFFLLSISVCLLHAQDAMILRNMENMTKGQLPNGMTFYLVDNGTSRGFCDYYLLQRVGTVNEDSTTRGFADLICRMAVRDSRNFRNGETLRFLNRLGVFASSDFEATVSSHGTLYSLRNVRTDNVQKQDSVLLLLANLAFPLDFSEKELQEVFRYRLNERLPLQEKEGKQPSIDSLKAFYHRFYGSNNQAVIIVGDIDRAMMEMKLKTLFQIVPKTIVPIVRKKSPDWDLDRMKISIEASETRQSAFLSFDFYADALPERYRLSAVPYVSDYMNYLMKELLQKRLMLQALVQGIPLKSIETVYGPYLDFEDREELSIRMECAPEHAEKVYAFGARELERIRLYGFTEQELTNMSETFVEEVSSKNNKYIPNRLYARKCFDNYLYSYSLSSLAEHALYLNKAQSKIGVSDINTYVRSYIRTALNTSTTYRYPVRDSLHLSEYRIRKILEDAQLDYSISEYRVDPRYVVNFNDSILPPVKDIVEFYDSLSNISYWTLPNGGRVIFKQMDTYDGNINMKAVSKRSVYPLTAQYTDLPERLHVLFSSYQMNGYGGGIIEREKKDRGIQLDWRFFRSSTSLVGKTRARQLRVFFKLINWYFTDLKFSAEGDPGIAEYIHSLTGTPSDYTFIFVGNADASTIRHYVESYLAVIPAKYNNEEPSGVMNVKDISRTRISQTIEKTMDHPYNFYRYTLEAFMPFTLENFILRQMCYYLLDMELKPVWAEKGIRLDMESEYVKYPMETQIFHFCFNTEGDGSQIIEGLASDLNSLAWKGISPEQFEILMNIIRNQFLYNQINSNLFWQELLTMRALYGKDYINNYSRILDELTPERFNESLKKLVYSSTRYVETVRGVHKKD